MNSQRAVAAKPSSALCHKPCFPLSNPMKWRMFCLQAKKQ